MGDAETITDAILATEKPQEDAATVTVSCTPPGVPGALATLVEALRVLTADERKILRQMLQADEEVT